MNHNGRVIGYDIFMGILATTIMVLIVVIFICRKRSIAAVNQSSLDGHQPHDQYPKAAAEAAALSLSSVDAATDGFNRGRDIGSGPLGTVYAAASHTGGLVAVKRIHPGLVLSNAGLGFSAALRSLSRARHRNVVPILGFSEAPGERIVVTDLAEAAASLDFLLHRGGGNGLDWARRVRIAAGAARGLDYLHEGVAPAVVHGRVKPSNVLVDAGSAVARLSDYGLGFLAPRETAGLAGYVDDEYWARGASRESDVYGLGVVLLELLSGRGCEVGRVVAWAVPLIRAGRLGEVLDRRPGPVPGCFDGPLARLAKVASACVANSRQSRPSASQVAAILTSLELEVCF